MADIGKLESMSMRDLIAYEKACVLLLSYIENNVNSPMDVELKNSYGKIGGVRDEIYGEMFKRVKSLEDPERNLVVD